MKKAQKSKLISLLLLLVFILAASFIIGQNLVYADGNGLEIKYPEIFGEPPVSTDTSIPDYVKYIFRFSVIIAGLVAFGALIYGGFSYLTSTGSPAKIADAKDRILSAFLGLIILLCSYLILYTINPQLVQFQLDELEKIEIPEKEAPPIEKEEKEFTFFQIPVGKIIERAVLSNQAETAVNQALNIPKDLEKKSKTLKNLTRDLKNLTDACKCNQSNCSPINLQTGQGCSGIGCPSAKCDSGAIKTKTDKIKKAIAELETTQQKLAAPNMILTDNSSELEKAGILMSLLHNEMDDYSRMSVSKDLKEKDDISVKFDYFPGWEDIKVDIDDSTINDPATFYFRKKGNENIIATAQTFGGSKMTLPPAATFSLSAPPSSFPSVETTSGILDIPVFHQDAGVWWNFIIDKCIDRLDNRMWYSGCGPTSLAMALRFLGINVTPADISSKVHLYNAFDCPGSNGSYFSNLARLAKHEYGVSYKTITYTQVKNEIEANHPVVTSCSNFNNLGWGHIIVIRGIKDGYVFINDPMSPSYSRFVSFPFPPNHKGKLSIDTYNAYRCGKYYYSFSK